MEALSARLAGENPPARGYIDCPCLERETQVFRKSGGEKKHALWINMCVFVCFSQPTERMGDLGHASRRDRVAGCVLCPGHPCYKIHTS